MDLSCPWPAYLWGSSSDAAIVQQTPTHTRLAATERSMSSGGSTAITAGVPDSLLPVNGPRHPPNVYGNGALIETLASLIGAVIATKTETVARMWLVCLTAFGAGIEVLGPSASVSTREPLRVVLARVPARRYYSQILETVVCFVAIFMMDVFLWSQPTAQMNLHNPSMFENPSSRVKEPTNQSNVSRRTQPSAMFWRMHIVYSIKVTTPGVIKHG